MRGCCSAIIAAAIVLGVATAAPAQAPQAPTIAPGAIEVGGAISLTTVAGKSTGTIHLRAGRFFGVFSQLIGVELGLSFRHISSQQVFGAELQSTWQRRMRTTPNYPFVSVAAGIRHEELGSFGSTRYPVGVGVGLRTLFGQRAALRSEYQYRRVMNDPIADLNEHQILVGLAVFFNNPK